MRRYRSLALLLAALFALAGAAFARAEGLGIEGASAVGASIGPSVSGRPARSGASSAKPDRTAVGVQLEETEYAVPGGDGDGDALFEGFVNRLFLGGGIAENAPLGPDLTGPDGRIYALLVVGIAEVAAGARSDTRFQLPLEDLGMTTSWTAGELGVESVVYSREEDGETRYYVADDAAAAGKALLDSQCALTLKALLAVLRADEPFELFWHDKTVNTGRTKSLSLSAEKTDGDEWRLCISGAYTYSFPVSADYAAQGSFDDNGRSYTTDAQRIASAQTAAQNAQAVVDANAGRDDLSKLNAYFDYICQHASYNRDALESGAPYGDPWQLIWVFDGDDATKVVCEGYAKAFQYLCDMSEFSGDIRCYCVSGDAGERHMWNVVRMDNGKGYLADLTNCDNDGIGAPDRLFLAGASSGGVEAGYRVSGGWGGVTYLYDDMTRTVFSESLLTLSARRYAVDNAPSAPAPQTEFTTPRRLARIEEETFSGIGAAGVRISENVESIGPLAFADCPNLRVFVVPAGVAEIDDSALQGCGDVTVYGERGTEAERFASDNGLAFIALADGASY